MFKGDYYIDISSECQAKLKLKNEITSFCIASKYDLPKIVKDVGVKDFLLAYENVAWLYPPFNNELIESIYPAHDVRKNQILDIIPMFLKEVLS